METGRLKAKAPRNKMKQLAELFGKKIDEEFSVYYRESTERCKFTEAGLFIQAENGKFVIADATLRHISTGAVDYEDGRAEKKTCGSCAWLEKDEGKPYYCAWHDLYDCHEEDDAACEDWRYGEQEDEHDGN